MTGPPTLVVVAVTGWVALSVAMRLLPVLLPKTLPAALLPIFAAVDLVFVVLEIGIVAMLVARQYYGLAAAVGVFFFGAFAYAGLTGSGQFVPPRPSATAIASQRQVITLGVASTVEGLYSTLRDVAGAPHDGSMLSLAGAECLRMAPAAQTELERAFANRLGPSAGCARALAGAASQGTFGFAPSDLAVNVDLSQDMRSARYLVGNGVAIDLRFDQNNQWTISNFEGLAVT